MLAGIIKYYRQLRTRWIKDNPRCAEFLPKVKEMGDFRYHIGRPALTVLEVFKDGVAYCGYSLYCEWDTEHGLGVLMHKNRIIEISDYDISVDTWTARIDRDGKNKKREREKLHAENKKRWEERQKQS